MFDKSLTNISLHYFLLLFQSFWNNKKWGGVDRDEHFAPIALPILLHQSCHTFEMVRQRLKGATFWSSG